MKNYIFFIFLICIAKLSFAQSGFDRPLAELPLVQSGFDRSLAEISFDLTYKLTRKNKKKVVVLFIKDINKSTTVAGKYLADVISVNIVNDTANFQVFDRDNLSGIVEANKLIAEGYIDVDKAKELGKLLSVEAIIIGNYTVLSNTIKLTIKALDANTGFIIAASMKDILLDNDAGALLGINVSSAGSTGNRGFNTPINPDEQINNPETVNKECETKNTGDYCFENKSAIKVLVEILGKGKSMSLDVGQTQCFYNLASTNYNYGIYKYNPHGNYGSFNMISKGQILVEKCRSKTFTIK